MRCVPRLRDGDGRLCVMGSTSDREYRLTAAGMPDYPPQGDESWRDVELMEAQDLTLAYLQAKMAAGRPAVLADGPPRRSHKRKAK